MTVYDSTTQARTVYEEMIEEIREYFCVTQRNLVYAIMPQQRDPFSCGIYTIMALLELLNGYDLPHNSIFNWRDRAAEVRRQILEFFILFKRIDPSAGSATDDQSTDEQPTDEQSNEDQSKEDQTVKIIEVGTVMEYFDVWVPIVPDLFVPESRTYEDVHPQKVNKRGKTRKKQGGPPLKKEKGSINDDVDDVEMEN